MGIREGFVRGFALPLVSALMLAAAGDAAVAQAQGQAAGDTVRLTIDFGNGVEKTFSALPHTDGMRVLEALEAAQDQPPGLDVEYWFNRVASRGVRSIDGVPGFPPTSGRDWHVFVNDRHVGEYVEPGGMMREEHQRKMNEQTAVAASDSIVLQRGKEPTAAAALAIGGASLSEAPSVGKLGEMVGHWRITLGEGVDAEAFEDAWASAAKGGFAVGHQTRGGIVTAAYLLKTEAIGEEYVWVVHWLREGGSPFGQRDAPADPKGFLAGVEVETSFDRYEVVDQSQ